MKQQTKKPDETATLIKAIKAVVCTNSVLPILECVHLTGDTLEVTDLETVVSMPFNSNVQDVCVPANKFIDALTLMESPQISQHPSCFAIDITEGKRKVKLSGDNPDNWPRHPLEGKEASDFFEIGEITEEIFARMRTALKFVSHDDLRPNMTGIFMGKDIVGTDAQRLYRHKLAAPFLETFILPAKVMKVLSVFGGNWKLFASVQYEMKNGKIVFRQIEGCSPEAVYELNHVAFTNDKGVLVITHVIDARFPDYNAVIPDDKPNSKVICFTGMLRKELKIANKYSNKSTSQVVFDVNGSTTISSCDIDFGYEYTNTLEEVEHKGENIQIGFNGQFLDEILGELPKDEPMTMKLWSPTKATIINDEFLLMPIMLNNC